MIDTPAVPQLHKAVMDHCLKRLETYVVPVSWADKGDANAEDLSALLTDPGRARVSAAVANLVDNDDVELLEYSNRLVSLINERSGEFEVIVISLQRPSPRRLETRLPCANSTRRKSASRTQEIRGGGARSRRPRAPAAEAATERASKPRRRLPSEAKAEADTERRALTSSNPL